MVPPDWLDVRPTVREALSGGVPVVALESTLISHGLPWPDNLETALACESAVRQRGAVPATAAVLRGRPTVGLNSSELEELARSTGVMKAARRELSVAVTRGVTAATTVSATLWLAHSAGVRVFATGGIGGVHRAAPGGPPDVSADLVELSRVPVLTVCAGAKSILDLPATLEWLETLGVVVAAYRSDDFPAFTTPSSGLRVPARVETPAEAARLSAAHWRMGGAGVLLCQATDHLEAFDAHEFEQLTAHAEADARAAGVRGAAVTPYLLGRLNELSGGRTLRVNRALIVANAALAAEIAAAFPTGLE